MNSDFAFLLSIAALILSIFVLITYFRLCGNGKAIKKILIVAFDLEPATNQQGIVIGGELRKKRMESDVSAT